MNRHAIDLPSMLNGGSVLGVAVHYQCMKKFYGIESRLLWVVLMHHQSSNLTITCGPKVQSNGSILLTRFHDSLAVAMRFLAKLTSYTLFATFLM